MDSNNFVAYYDGEKIISGGYIINDMNIVSSLAGGSNNFNDKNIFENDDEFIIFDEIDDKNYKTNKKINGPLYAIPAGLISVEIEKHTIPSNIDINYSPKDVLDDNIFDNLYNSAIIENKNNNEKIKHSDKTNKTNKMNKNKITKKSKNKVIKKNNKKTKSNKK